MSILLNLPLFQQQQISNLETELDHLEFEKAAVDSRIAAVRRELRALRRTNPEAHESVHGLCPIPAPGDD